MSSTTNFAQSEFRYDDGKSPLALLAETCRNIGVDTSTSKLTKSSIDHTKSSSKSSTSPTNSSSSSSLESTRKSNDSSCRLSVSPLKNGSDKSQSNLSVSSNNNNINRISANSVPGSSTNTNLGLNGNSTTHNNNVKVNNNGSSHHSPNYTGTSVITVNNNNNREPTKFSFKPYEDHVTHKRTCLEDSRSLSAFTHNYPHQLQQQQQQQSSRSPLNSDIKNNNKDNQYVNNNSVNASSSNKTNSSESTKRDSVTNGGGGGTPPTLPLTNGYDEPVNKKMQKYSSLESTSSSSSSTPSLSNTSSSTPSAVSKSNHNSSTNNNANTTTTSSAHTSDSPSSKSSNHHHHQQQHQLTVDNVNKFVPYSSISSYLHGLPHHPSAYDPATAARLNAAAAAVAGYCHSPSMCRDPFCPGCRFSAASNVLGQVSPCAAGCTQCSHVAAAAASPMTASSINLAAALHQANAASASPYLNPGNAFYPLLPTPAHHPSAANHPNNPSAHQQQQPGNVNNNMNKLTCNWMANGNYCGKRFSTAEELHQHLRNHTSSDPSSVSALAFLGQYPHLDPMLTSPIAGLRRTAFDPVNRYHPYKPTFTNLPNGLTAGSPNMHHPSTHPASSPRTQMNLSYPPYGPYAGRLGPPIPP